MLGLILIGIILALVTILVLAAVFTHSNYNRCKIIISLLFLNSAYTSTIGILGQNIWLSKVHQFIFTDIPLYFLNGPLVYFYILSLTKTDFKIKNNLGHIKPFLIVSLLSLELVRLNPEDKIQLMYLPQYQWLHLARNLIISLFGLFYIVLSFKALKKFEERVKNVLSSVEELKLEWLEIIFKTVTALWFVRLAYFILVKQTEIFKSSFIVDYGLYITTTLGLMFLTFSALKRSSVLQMVEAEKADLLIEKKEFSPGYKIPEVELKKLKEKLLEVIETQKPFLNPLLKLSDLATMMNRPSYVVSQVINDGFNRNFYEFINKYRVEEASRILKLPESKNLTILAVAEDSGFNSKSVFNSVFKKYTGLTPSEFRD